MKHATLSCAVTLAVASGCAHNQAVPAQAEPAPIQLRPVLVQLEGRRQVMTVLAAPGSPLFTVKSSDGTVQAPPMTLADLRASHPEIAASIETLRASCDGIVWAGM